MSPERARVFVVDDNDDYRDSLKEFLILSGHTVIAEATSLGSAMETIKGLENVDVALIDGNLSETSRGGYDGARVAKEFREKFPGVPLYAISVDSQPWSDDPTLTKLNESWVIAERVTKA